MATGRIVVTPMFVTHHKTPIPPVVTANHPPPPGKTQYGTQSSHIFRAWGKASNAPAPSMVFKLTSEVTGPQTDAGKAKEP